MRLETRLGPLVLRSPLIAASGTVGAVVDFAGYGTLGLYGGAVAKSVSADPWPGRPAPRVTHVGSGMLNAVGIQNPGVEAWLDRYADEIASLPVPVWGSAVGNTVEEFVTVAKSLSTAPVAAIELNLSCPNLEGEGMFALDAAATGAVVKAVRSAVDLPLGAKLSPNAVDIVSIAEAAHTAGADWLVLTNTVWGAAIDIGTGTSRLSAPVGGMSGPPLKPIALRCVVEVHQALPSVPAVGCGGVGSAQDVIEYLMAGASAVAVGTAHFESPRVARTITRGLVRYGKRRGIEGIDELIGVVA